MRPRLAPQDVPAVPLAIAIQVLGHPTRVGPPGLVMPPVVVAVRFPAAIVVEGPFAAIVAPIITDDDRIAPVAMTAPMIVPITAAALPIPGSAMDPDGNAGVDPGEGRSGPEAGERSAGAVGKSGSAA